MRVNRDKLLAVLLIINFIGVSIAVTLASWLRPFYGMISFPAVVLVLVGAFYTYRRFKTAE